MAMNAPIRILLVTNDWPTPERPLDVPFMPRHVDFLRRAGAQVEVFAFRGAKNPLNYLKAWARLRATMRRGDYDLVHAHFGQAALLPWPKRLPLVVTFHGCDVQGDKGPDGKTTLPGRMLQTLSRLVARRADAVVVVSARLRRFLPASVTASVIPLGLDFEKFPDVTPEQARRELDLPADERLVLFVGDPAMIVKRFDLAWRAVALLRERTPARLVVGSGFTNARILMLMRACDALLLTSIQEGSPTVVKEALASDLPVVSVDVGDVRERIGEVAGCEVCADDSAETIAGALERVLARGERVNGRDAVKDLDEREIARRVIAVYESVLGPAAERRAASPSVAHGDALRRV